MNSDSDRPNRIPWPPILDVVTVAVAYGLERLLPLGLLPEAAALQVAGAIMIGIGIAVALAAIVRFKSIGTPVDPTGRATRLATDGIYRLTRNPMYVGTLILLAGLALALGWSWLLLLPVLAVLLYRLAIRREEAFLERRFGAEYFAYRRRVRRWL